MSFWSRIANVFRGERLNREIDEEFEAHIEEAVEHGMGADEARRAFGHILRRREESRDARIAARLDSLRADAVFGWRQLNRTKVTSAAAILSLALGIGACTSAFRLVDALLLRPLPVANPERIYDVFRQEIGWDGKPGTFDGWAYPIFRQMRAAVRDQADLIAISFAERTDLTYRSDQEMEKAYLQYVSGGMFGAFGLRPALGRLFAERDDDEPGAHPYAVLTYDYWKRRFERDPAVIGRVFRMGNRLYQIIGVAEEGFTGTEPGTVIDIFVPTMMNPAVSRADSTWHRTLALLKPNASVEPLRQRLDALSLAFERERSKSFTDLSKQALENYLKQRVMVEPAPTGVSDMQNGNRRALIALSVLVGMVLLSTCAIVATLLTAQAAARGREMALRVSIGAGRLRLVQLLLVESAMLALAAAGLGALFAWRAAPLVVAMINPPANPARLILPADWRVVGFGMALAIGVTLLSGLTPALRASAIVPMSALKGGEDPHSPRRAMHALIAVQVVLCFVVLFVAGLFVATFERLSNLPAGFSAERILTLDTVAQNASAELWDQVAEHLRTVSGVEKVALAGWPLLSGHGWNDSISVNGGPLSDDLAYFLNVSPGWVDVMKIPFTEGGDFQPADTYPGAAIVNQTFARRYFPGVDAMGKFFEQSEDNGVRKRLRIAGVVRDARYRGARDVIPPVVYVPFHAVDKTGVQEAIKRGTFIVRTSGANPLALASMLRSEIPKARSEFRVSNIRTQLEIDEALTVRERLLAMLAMFFAAVALLLAGIGFYGVVSYAVLQRRRELGIRIALGAPSADIAYRVLGDILQTVLLGAGGGLALALALARSIEPLLYGVKSTDAGMLAIPWLIVPAAALLAAIPPVVRALQIDPAGMLRAE